MPREGVSIPKNPAMPMRLSRDLISPKHLMPSKRVKKKKAKKKAKRKANQKTKTRLRNLKTKLRNLKTKKLLTLTLSRWKRSILTMLR